MAAQSKRKPTFISRPSLEMVEWCVANHRGMRSFVNTERADRGGLRGIIGESNGNGGFYLLDEGGEAELGREISYKSVKAITIMYSEEK